MPFGVCLNTLILSCATADCFAVSPSPTSYEPERSTARSRYKLSGAHWVDPIILSDVLDPENSGSRERTGHAHTPATQENPPALMADSIVDRSSVPRTLFIDQSGELGGAELSLLDVVSSWGAPCKVVVLQQGDFVTALRERGIEAEIISLGSAIRTRRDSKIWDYVKASPSAIKAVLQLAARARQYDLVYANSQKAFVIGSMAAWLAGKPCIWHLRDMLTASHFSDSGRKIVVRLANLFAARVIANSEATAQAFREAGGDPRKIDVVYNGFREADYQENLPQQASQLRAELRCGAAPLIGCFSRLAEWKGQHIILEAMAALPETHLVLVGGPLFGEQAYARRLIRRVRELDIGRRVHFLGFRRNVAALMAGVDVVVHSSIAPEPFGRVVVEAMLIGRPIVATAAGGVTELIRDSRSGSLVAPGNVAGLIAALSRLQTGDHGAAAAIRAQRFAKKHFLLASSVKRLQTICRDSAEL